jgi:hypothetical protein
MYIMGHKVSVGCLPPPPPPFPFSLNSPPPPICLSKKPAARSHSIPCVQVHACPWIHTHTHTHTHTNGEGRGSEGGGERRIPLRKKRGGKRRDGKEGARYSADKRHRGKFIIVKQTVHALKSSLEPKHPLAMHQQWGLNIIGNQRLFMCPDIRLT